MITTKNELDEYLTCEKDKYHIPKGIRFAAHWFIGTEAIIIWKFQRCLRKTEYHMNTGHKIRYFLYLKRLNYLKNLTGFHIDCNVFDKGLHLMHLGHILTNSNAKIGQNASIHINTAFVASGRDSSTPVIGNNVVVGVGATVVGGVYIADGIAIGANALVNKSFLEKNIGIAGVPAKKISDNGRNAWNKSRVETLRGKL